MATHISTIAMMTGLVAIENAVDDWVLKSIFAIILGVCYWGVNRYIKTNDERHKKHESMCDEHVKMLQTLLDFKWSRQEIVQIFKESITEVMRNGLGDFIRKEIDIAVEKHLMLNKRKTTKRKNNATT